MPRPNKPLIAAALLPWALASIAHAQSLEVRDVGLDTGRAADISWSLPADIETRVARQELWLGTLEKAEGETPEPEDPVIEFDGRTFRVAPGDSLWRMKSGDMTWLLRSGLYTLDAKGRRWDLVIDEDGTPALGAEHPAREGSEAETGRTISIAFTFVMILDAEQRSHRVEPLDRGNAYLFRVVALDADGAELHVAEADDLLVTAWEWFDGSRFWLAIITVIFCGSVIFWINHARKGRPLKIRKIAGLEAVTEAVGRATEMGRPILYVPGILDMNDVQTIAGINILSRVAQTAAEYGAHVEVPTCKSLVMTVAQETIEAAFLSAGRPDGFNRDHIYYVTDEQFGYVAYLSGHMVREKPAVCFYMGAFFAESLILAETGNAIGAIQVAGTAMPAQLPFFVASCDYTLIGEEFFAASAYLTGSAEELGSLKGQDVGKVIVAALLVAGVTFATLHAMDIAGAGMVVDFITETILG